MTSTDMIRAYVEKLAAERFSGGGPLHIDEDGSIPVRRGSAIYYIDVVEPGEAPALVRVWSIVLHGVKKKKSLLEMLNHINTNLLQARIYHDDDDDVIISTELLAESVTAENLAQATDMIGRLADGIDDELQALFSGEKPLGDEDDEDAVVV